MNLTVAKKKRIIKALRAARPLIKSGQEQYVCYAIDQALDQNKIRRVDCRLAEWYIQRLIAPHCTVSTWFRVTYPLTPLYGVVSTWRKYRLAWIDHMIKELSK